MDRQPNVNDLQRAVHELETALLKVEALYSGTAYEGSAMLNAARAVMGGCQRSSRRLQLVALGVLDDDLRPAPRIGPEHARLQVVALPRLQADGAVDHDFLHCGHLPAGARGRGPSIAVRGPARGARGCRGG